MNPIYLWVDLAVLLPTLALSFDKRVSFRSKWKSYWPVNAAVTSLFIAWDILFTEAGIWGFNPDYLLGVDLLGLPIEEWGFFIAIPYACTFSYVTLKHYFNVRPAYRYGTASLNMLVWLVCIGLVFQFTDRAYTLSASFGLALMLTWLMRQHRPWISMFWLAYTALLIPFIVTNGVLTGLDFYSYPILHMKPESIEDHIVWYNAMENTGVRIFSMPLDDLIYGALLMLMHVAGLEWMEQRRT